METIGNVELYGDDITDVNQVIVNTELGAFGDNNVLWFCAHSLGSNSDKLSANPASNCMDVFINRN